LGSGDGTQFPAWQLPVEQARYAAKGAARANVLTQGSTKPTPDPGRTPGPQLRRTLDALVAGADD
jgi:hypothetical protein